MESDSNSQGLRADAQDPYAEAGIEEMREARAELRALLKSRGWARLVEALQQTATNMNSVMAHEVTATYALDLAQARGKIVGLQIAHDLPNTLIEDLDSLIEELEREDADHAADADD